MQCFARSPHLLTHGDFLQAVAQVVNVRPQSWTQSWFELSSGVACEETSDTLALGAGAAAIVCGGDSKALVGSGQAMVGPSVASAVPGPPALETRTSPAA